MRYTIIALLLISFVGCNENMTQEHESKPVIIQQPEVKKDEPKTITKKIGIDISNDKISIDLNKTKSFFNSLGKTLEKKATEVEEKIKHGDGNFSENMGVVITSDKIDIDMKKANSFLDSIVKDFTSIMEETIKELSEEKK